jgi:hypothetical protein
MKALANKLSFANFLASRSHFFGETIAFLSDAGMSGAYSARHER